MYSLRKPGYDPETMRAVALAYRRERQAGQLDQPAREAAIAGFQARYPGSALERHEIREIEHYYLTVRDFGSRGMSFEEEQAHYEPS